MGSWLKLIINLPSNSTIWFLHQANYIFFSTRNHVIKTVIKRQQLTCHAVAVSCCHVCCHSSSLWLLRRFCLVVSGKHFDENLESHSKNDRVTYPLSRWLTFVTLNTVTLLARFPVAIPLRISRYTAKNQCDVLKVMLVPVTFVGFVFPRNKEAKIPSFLPHIPLSPFLIPTPIPHLSRHSQSLFPCLAPAPF